MEKIFENYLVDQWGEKYKELKYHFKEDGIYISVRNIEFPQNSFKEKRISDINCLSLSDSQLKEIADNFYEKWGYREFLSSTNIIFGKTITADDLYWAITTPNFTEIDWHLLSNGSSNEIDEFYNDIFDRVYNLYSISFEKDYIIIYDEYDEKIEYQLKINEEKFTANSKKVVSIPKDLDKKLRKFYGYFALLQFPGNINFDYGYSLGTDYTTYQWYTIAKLYFPKEVFIFEEEKKKEKPQKPTSITIEDVYEDKFYTYKVGDKLAPYAPDLTVKEIISNIAIKADDGKDYTFDGENQVWIEW